MPREQIEWTHFYIESYQGSYHIVLQINTVSKSSLDLKVLRIWVAYHCPKSLVWPKILLLNETVRKVALIKRLRVLDNRATLSGTGERTIWLRRSPFAAGCPRWTLTTATSTGSSKSATSTSPSSEIPGGPRTSRCETQTRVLVFVISCSVSLNKSTTPNVLGYVFVQEYQYIFQGFSKSSSHPVNGRPLAWMISLHQRIGINDSPPSTNMYRDYLWSA